MCGNAVWLNIMVPSTLLEFDTERIATILIVSHLSRTLADSRDRCGRRPGQQAAPAFDPVDKLGLRARSGGRGCARKE